MKPKMKPIEITITPEMELFLKKERKAQKDFKKEFDAALVNVDKNDGNAVYVALTQHFLSKL